MAQRTYYLLLLLPLFLLSACSSLQNSIVVNLKDGSSIKVSTERDIADFKKFLAINNPDNYQSLSNIPPEFKKEIIKLKSIEWENSVLDVRDNKFYLTNGNEQTDFFPRASLLVLAYQTIRDYEKSRDFYNSSDVFDFDSYEFLDRRTRRKIKVDEKGKVEALKDFLMKMKADKTRHISYLDFSVYLSLSQLNIELYKGSQFIGEIDFNFSSEYPLIKINIQELSLKYVDRKNLLLSLMGMKD